jgi:ubiquinone/menaquinone biosynthesis C-methylase UbiE
MDTVTDSNQYYYDMFRPELPVELLERLVSEAKRGAFVHSLLDVSTGSGKVLEQFLPYFNDIVAVEPDPDLLQAAKRRLIPHMHAETSLFFLDASPEIIPFPPHWTASLATICRSFHLMDQERLLAHLDEVVESRGVVAIFSDTCLLLQNNPWVLAARQVVETYLTKPRPRAEDIYQQPAANVEEMLKSSPFSATEHFSLPVRRTWSPQEVLDYLYSTAYAAKPQFGDRVNEFEAALRDTLHRVVPNDQLPEDNEFAVILGRRPQAA